MPTRLRRISEVVIPTPRFDGIAVDHVLTGQRGVREDRTMGVSDKKGGHGFVRLIAHDTVPAGSVPGSK
jgi:hypothetical protein